MAFDGTRVDGTSGPREVEAGARLTVAPLPEWVEHAPFTPPETTADTFSSGGLCLLLRDHQIDATGAEKAFHNHFMWRVLTASGAANVAQISRIFDPLTERLEFHTIRIWRDGSLIDLTKRDAFTLMRREQNLERHILDGRVTATYILPDVRPGDIVEQSWTLYENHPVLRSRFCEFIAFPEQAIELRQRLRLPQNNSVVFKFFGAPIEATTSTQDGITTYSWGSTLTETIPVEDYSPPWVLRGHWLQCSDAPDWSDISRILCSHYTPSAIPDTVKNEAERICATHSTPANRMMAILATVQKRLRYLSVSLGEGGLVPRPLEEIWTSGYGDCKESSVLFVTLAKLCGLTAAPALVSTCRGPGMDTFLPTLGLFDHCIVRVNIASKNYWIDPTCRYQPTNADHHSNRWQGFALPLTQAGDDLEDMGAEPVCTFVEAQEELVFGAHLKDPAHFTLNLSYAGLPAQDIRAFIADHGLPTYAERIRNRYHTEWPRLSEVAPMTMQENAEEGTVTLTVEYTIPDIWVIDQNRATARIVDHVIEGELGNLAQTDNRKDAISLGHPHRVKRHATIIMPRNWSISETDDIHKIDGATYTERMFLREARQIVVHQELEISRPFAPPSEAKGYSEMTKAMNNRPALLLSTDVKKGDFSDLKPNKKYGWGKAAIFIWIAIVLLANLARSLDNNHTYESSTQQLKPESAQPPYATQSTAHPLPKGMETEKLEIKDIEWLNKEAHKSEQPSQTETAPAP